MVEIHDYSIHTKQRATTPTRTVPSVTQMQMPTMLVFTSGSLLVLSCLLGLRLLLLLSANQKNNTVALPQVNSRAHHRRLQVQECSGEDTGELQSGFSVQNGACIETSSPNNVFFYGIQQGPVSANGLQAGAPTDIAILFGSVGSTVDRALDPQSLGLQIPGGGGRLILDFGPEFVYDTAASLQPVPNNVVDLNSAVGNEIAGNTCPASPSSLEGGIICADWEAEFGASNQQIIITPQSDSGLIGDRAEQVGVKLARIHPIINTSNGLYRNAKGVCSAPPDSYVFCVADSDCDGATCDEQAVIGSITATVLDSAGGVVQKASQSVEFAQAARFSIFPTNIGLSNDKEVVESVDFQRALPGDKCELFGKPDAGDLFSIGVPCYAPRFIIFAPKSNGEGYPHDGVDDLGFTVNGDNDGGTITSNGQVIGAFETVDEFSFTPGRIEPPSAGTSTQIANPPSGIGGSILAIPLRTSSTDEPAVYTIKITLIGGAEAISRVVVDV